MKTATRHNLYDAAWCLALLVMLAGTTGCRRESERSANDASAQRERSNLAVMADGITGRQAVRSGQQARGQIEGVAADRDKQLEQILGEQ